ncbi:MAG: single-stranded DNA-binding protein [Lewinellaceae bacterium]|nr:single-stranded DNA-binding protein [Lewinellaceae bacterium]
MVNKVILVGHLGKDPDVRTLENGTKVGSFTVATNENYRDKNDQWQSITEWHNVVVWRYQAEKAERELKKGSLVFIEGKITHRKYQTSDGQERFITEIVASTINALDKRERSGLSDSAFPTMENDPLMKVDGGSSSPSTFTPADSPIDDLPF